MPSVGDVVNRTPIAAVVQFTKMTKEVQPGVFKDVDMVTVFAPYSDGRENVKHEVADWWPLLETDIRQSRIPQDWLDKYREGYERWKKGQEPAVDGVPIKGWGIISPAQQETLLRMQIRTVEELAQINETGMRAIGMGAVDLKNKAQAWLTQLQDKAPLVMEIAAVKRENEILKGSLASLQEKVTRLLNAQPEIPMEYVMEPEPAPQPPKRPRGNPNWQKKESP